MSEPTHEEQVAGLNYEAERYENLASNCEIAAPISSAAYKHRAQVIRALLARLEADQWRPIEEAPKDDSWYPIEGWRPRRGVARIRWEADKYAKKPKPYWASNDAHRVTEDRQDQPTHWRRLSRGPALPAPPSDTPSQDGAGDGR